MAQVGLFKKVGKYTDKKDGKEKTFVNFYVLCGDALIPVEVKFFENEEGKDYQYSGRKAVLAAFSEVLPDKEEDGEVPKEKDKKKKPKLESFDDDGDNPF